MPARSAVITIPRVSDKPLIVLANDDGIQARGLQALGERLADLGEILVVAPNRERSATSHAFTLDRPLRVEEVCPGWYSVDGTPVDCVYIALLKMAARRPALLVSGINHGLNLGSDVFYSGTVACAVEATIRGTPSLAMSFEYHRGDRDFRYAADFAHALARAILVEGLPSGTLLNVNVPAGRPRGYRWTRLGRRLYRDQVDERADLRGRNYYWIGGPPEDSHYKQEPPGSDSHAVGHEIVSVTPLDLDLTSHGLLAKLPGWTVEGFEAVVEEEEPRA